jgi:hypothetical protein
MKFFIQVVNLVMESLWANESLGWVVVVPCADYYEVADE